MKLAEKFLGICSAVLVLLLAISSPSLSAWGTKELETEKIAATFSKEVLTGGYQVVTTEELKKWIEEKKDLLIVDTMPFEGSYKKEHIPGAVNFEFPVTEVTKLNEETKAAFLKLLGPNQERTIVFYCGFTKCGRSHNGAMWAVKLGYKNVYRCPGGIKGWTEAGFPVEASK